MTRTFRRTFSTPTTGALANCSMGPFQGFRLLMAALAFLLVVSSLFLLRFFLPFRFVTSTDNSLPENKFMVNVSVDGVLLTDAFNPETEDVRLETVLKKAAMKDRTVILTTLNGAWAAPSSVMDLFLESFHYGDHTHGLLEHLIIVALDKTAFARCLSVHRHCFALATEGIDFSGEKVFMTADYLKMMWRRIPFLQSVLEKGYNFIFTDADVMWLRDPSPHFYPDADFQIACDEYAGSPLDLHSILNGGFMYVISNNRTIDFYKFWYAARVIYPGQHDQDVLNIIKHSAFVMNLNLHMKFLDTASFGGLCQLSDDFNIACTMHANCCIGLENKLHDLRVILEDWRRYMSLPPSEKQSGLASWRVPQKCSYFSDHH